MEAAVELYGVDAALKILQSAFIADGRLPHSAVCSVYEAPVLHALLRGTGVTVIEDFRRMSEAIELVYTCAAPTVESAGT